MSNGLTWLKHHRGFSWAVAAAFLYALATLYYMGGALTHCSTSLVGGVGDESAGLIWLNSVNHTSPLWGFTHATNYPYGEQLTQPVYASGSAEYFLYWILALIAGSVCGYNLLNFVGFLSAALVMFLFVRWLTRSQWVALLAGFAVSFTPYVQDASGVHPSYGYIALFIGLLWAFLVYWEKPTVKLAAGLGIMTALSFYWDPYFVLFGGVLWVAMLVGAGIYEITRQQDMARLKIRLGYGLVAAGTLALLLLPLVYVRLDYAGQIDQIVSGSRNAIKFDAQIYAARPSEYLLPVATQPILKALIPGYATRRNHHTSNPAEYTINLSLTLIAVVVIAACILAWRIWRNRRLAPSGFNLRADARLLLPVVAAVGILAFAFSLPPVSRGVHLPTWYLTDIVTMWRVFARLYLLVNMALVVVAAVALVYLSFWIKRPLYRRLGWALVLVLVAFEYQTFVPPRPVWSYIANVPAVYRWMHSSPRVHVLAEYPLDEPAVTIYPTFYLTFQRISGKPMIDASLAGSPQAPIRESLRTLADPQTLPSLRALGVDTVVVHGVNGDVRIAGLELMKYEAAPSVKSTNGVNPPGLYPIGVYHLAAGPKDAFDLVPETGFVYPQKLTPVSYHYIGGNGSTLELVALPGAPKSNSSQLCTQISAQVGTTATVSLSQDGQQIWSGPLSPSWQDIDVSARVSDPITIKSTDHDLATVVFRDLGCPL